MASLSKQRLTSRRFEFSSTASKKEDGRPYEFAVVEMDGFEAISQPFRFTLTLVSDDPSIEFAAMLRNPATFTIYSPDGNVATPYHGVLAEFDQQHRADGYVFYRAVLVPRLWRLSLYRCSEAYSEEQPITTTLESVLRSAKLGSDDYEFRLTSVYRARSFVCQYEETHLSFVSRWMENEGIYYYFDHSGEVDKLIAVDSRTMHDAAEAKIEYRPDDELDVGVSGRSVRDFAGRQKPMPREVILQEYNYRKAALQLKVSAVVSESGIGQVVLYGENFRDEAEGRRYARVRAEEIDCRGLVFSAESTAVGLRCGYFAELSHHYRDDFNGRYLVTEIHHQGSQAGALLSGIEGPHHSGDSSSGISYRNSFRAIPAQVQYRPERITSKPRVAGTMNATVDSEGSGQYAELDEHGQYKVQLPFDLTDKNANKGSARIRMATPYSGSDHGMHFPLHKGAEVLLSFADGDPDRPVIVGTVPNSENRSLVNQANAYENRITTAGGNQVYMGDAKGKEVMLLHSPTGNSTVGLGATNAEERGILVTTGGSWQMVTVGVNNSVLAGAKNSVALSSDNSLVSGMANKYTMGLNTSVDAGASVALKHGQTITLDYGKSVSLKTVDTTKANEKVTIQAGQDISISRAITATKVAVFSALTTNLAANAAAAGATAGLLIDKGNGGDIPEILKQKYVNEASADATKWQPNSTGTLTNALSGAIIGAGTQALVQGFGKFLANTLENKDNTYASTVEIDRGRVLIKHKTPASNPEFAGKTSSLAMKCGDWSARADGKIWLNAEDNVWVDAEKDVLINGDSIELKSSNSYVNIKSEKKSISIDAADSVRIDAESLARIKSKTFQVDSGSSGLHLNSQGSAYLNAKKNAMIYAGDNASIKGNRVGIDGNTVFVNGQLIQLG